MNLRSKFLFSIFFSITLNAPAVHLQAFDECSEHFEGIDIFHQETEPDQLYTIPFQDNSQCNYQAGWTPEGFIIRSELLYLKPTVDQSYYLITSNDTRSTIGNNLLPNGRRHSNSVSFEPGFRVEGLCHLPNEWNQLDCRFTCFTSAHTDSASGDFLFDVIGFPGDGAQDPEDTTYAGTANLRKIFLYYAADATVNRYALSDYCENLSLLFGIHYAYIKVKDNFTGTGVYSDSGIRNVNNHVRRDSRFWGIGPQLGMDYRYVFPSSFFPGVLSLVANGRASLLGGNTEASFHYTTTRTGAIGVNIRNDDLWRVTPGLDAKVGLSYNFCCGNMEATVEFGYELMWYSSCIDTITGMDVAYAGDSIDVLSSVNMQGPYAAITVSF